MLNGLTQAALIDDKEDESTHGSERLLEFFGPVNHLPTLSDLALREALEAFSCREDGAMRLVVIQEEDGGNTCLFADHRTDLRPSKFIKQWTLGLKACLCARLVSILVDVRL